jgi:imidazolonepropionase-like amidohydrolase
MNNQLYSTSPRAPQPDIYAIIADGFWNGISEKPAKNLAVIVKDQIIQDIISVYMLPNNINTIKLPGCTLLPGLIDAHVHYSSVMGPAFLSAGVTTVRDVGNDLHWILKERSFNESNKDRGPTIVCCGHLQDGPVKYWPNMGRANINADSVRSSIKEHIKAGVDAIKLYDGLDVEMVYAGIDEAHKLGKPVTAHLGECSIEDAVSAGLDCIEHLSGCKAAWSNSTQKQDDVLIDLLLKHHVAIDPTLVIFDRVAKELDLVFARDNSRNWVHPSHLHYWNEYGYPKSNDSQMRLKHQQEILYLKRFLLRAHKSGVTTAIGTDTPFPRLAPGFSLHDEMANYVDAGIKPVDALRSATSVNAKVLKKESIIGKIAKGFDADFVAVKGNPINDIRDIQNTELVIRKGMVISQEKIQKDLKSTFDNIPNDAITLDFLDRIK